MKGVTLITEAYSFAMARHQGQTRKYTGEPYIVHPIAVANLVMSVGGTPEMIAAALLHDVVEDCGVEFEQIQNLFGDQVMCMVEGLTEFRPEGWNRAKRKAYFKERLMYASPATQTIKVADLIDNTKDIVKFDPDFAKVYIREKLELLQVLTKADARLVLQANKQLEEYKNGK